MSTMTIQQTRKQDRRRARALKQAMFTPMPYMPAPELSPGAPKAIPAPAPAIQTRSLPASAGQAATVKAPSRDAQTASGLAPVPARRESPPRRTREERVRSVEQYEARLMAALAGVRAQARRQVSTDAGDRVLDALTVVGDPSSRPWRKQHERLEAALASGSREAVRDSAASACSEITRDSVRSSRHAPNHDVALRAATAYGVIAIASRTAINTHQPNA